MIGIQQRECCNNRQHAPIDITVVLLSQDEKPGGLMNNHVTLAIGSQCRLLTQLAYILTLARGLNITEIYISLHSMYLIKALSIEYRHWRSDNDVWMTEKPLFAIKLIVTPISVWREMPANTE